MDITSYLLGKKSSGGGGGGGSTHDWESIGFNSEPQSITDAYNYAKVVQREYDNSKSYANDYSLVYFPYVDSSSRTSFNSIFKDCCSLEEIALIDTSSAENFYNMFYECRALKRLPQFNTSKVRNMSLMCNGCRSLKDIPVFDTSSVTNMSFAFGSCYSLSNDSLNNIMKMCINATGITSSSNKTLQKIGLSSTQATTCQSLSNYQDFIDAGWTIGY